MGKSCNIPSACVSSFSAATSFLLWNNNYLLPSTLMDSSSEYVGNQQSGWTTILCGSLHDDDHDDGVVDDDSYKDDDSLASDASSGHKNDEIVEKRVGYNEHDDGEIGDDYRDTEDCHRDDSDDDGGGGGDDEDGIRDFRISDDDARKWRKSSPKRREKTENGEPFTPRVDDFSSQCSTTKVRNYYR